MARRSLFLILFLFLLNAWVAPEVTRAQSHFSNCLNGTGNVFSATVVVPASSTPDINGDPLANGSEIAVFSSQAAFPDLCVGAMVWQGGHGYITVWGDDALTLNRDGLLTNETLYYRVWDSASQVEYRTELVTARYSQGNGRYGNDKIMILADLSVASLPLVPFTIEPANSAPAVSTNPLLKWHAAADAIDYRVQLALGTDTHFAHPLVDAVVSTTLFDGGALDLETMADYRWRVQARTPKGFTPWSETATFSTAAFDLTLKKVFLNRRGVKVAKLAWRVEQVPKGKVDMYMDSSFVKRTTNDGVAKQKIKTSGNGPYRIYMCRKNSTTFCSNTILADFSAAAVDLTEPDGDDDYDDYVSYSIGQEEPSALVAERLADVPEEVGLYATYPNPFNDVTTIAYGLPEQTHVTIDVYNMLGQRVKQLVSETVPAGRHTVQWQGGDMPSGVYICRLQADGAVLTRTVTIVK